MRHLQLDPELGFEVPLGAAAGLHGSGRIRAGRGGREGFDRTELPHAVRAERRLPACSAGLSRPGTPPYKHYR